MGERPIHSIKCYPCMPIQPGLGESVGGLEWDVDGWQVGGGGAGRKKCNGRKSPESFGAGFA